MFIDFQRVQKTAFADTRRAIGNVERNLFNAHSGYGIIGQLDSTDTQNHEYRHYQRKFDDDIAAVVTAQANEKGANFLHVMGRA